MMTDDEAEDRAKQMIKSERMIEAGFVMLLLSIAPDNVTQKEVNGVRATFFTGAKYMFDLLCTYLPDGDRSVIDLLTNIEEELKKHSVSKPVGTVN